MMKLLLAVTDRLAWFCTMIVLSVVGLISPKLLMSIMGQDLNDNQKTEDL